MSKRGFEDFHPVIVKCGILITALSHSKIRVKDILFHISLVKDMFRSSNHFQDFDLQAVQVIRFFEKYKAKGWARSENEGQVKVFFLTPEGVLDIFASLVKLDYILPTAEAIFLQSFIEGYGPYMRRFLEKGISAEERGQLEEWLRPAFIYKQQIKAVEAGILDLELRIRDSLLLQKFIAEGRAKGLDHKSLIASLPSDFSYRLSHQKRLKEWLSELPDEVQVYELDKGLAARQTTLYQPSLRHLEMLKSFYQTLLS